MSEYTAQITDVASNTSVASVVNRRSYLVVSGLLQYYKTGAGTCILHAVDAYNSADLISRTLATGAQAATVEFALARSYYLKVDSGNGTYAVSARVDGNA